MRNEMVNVGEFRISRHDTDVPEAVEALAFLVAVQSVPRRCHVDTLFESVPHKKQRRLVVIRDGQQCGVHTQVPGSLNESPSAFGFWSEAGKLDGLLQPQK